VSPLLPAEPYEAADYTEGRAVWGQQRLRQGFTAPARNSALTTLSSPKFSDEFAELTLLNSRAHATHQHLVKVQIVDTVKPRA
jgi:hypothetical protein